MDEPLTIAANNGDIGGAEIMLLNIARAAGRIGYRVNVLGPETPDDLVRSAAEEGFEVTALASKTRAHYMAQLRRWDRRFRRGLLWCNGLVPSFATGGHRGRIVHLHQLPEGTLKALVAPARHNAQVTLVPSAFAAQRVRGAVPFHNWVGKVDRPAAAGVRGPVVRVGFLGRPSRIKGTDLLAGAVGKLNSMNGQISYELKIAGEPRYITGRDLARVQAALNRLGDNAVQMGWIPAREFFEHIDMLVCPSVWDEVFGLVAAEAMSASMPLIVSDAGALPEVVGPGYPWVVARDSVAELANAIEVLARQIVADSDGLHRVLEHSLRRWGQEFSPEAGHSRVRDLLAGVSR